MIRQAFTLIELVFVIVVLGILGGIGSDILKSTYENYAMQRSISNLQLKTTASLEIITAYLHHAIQPSVAIDGDTLDHESIAYITRGGESTIDSTKALVWIGKDTESLRGIWKDTNETGKRVYPAYSGLANIEESNATHINTTDCDLSDVGSIQDAIVNGNTSPAIYFVYANSEGNAESRFWQADPTSLFELNEAELANDLLVMDDTPAEISERYYLSYSAYALRFDNGNLMLKSNFQPWDGETYADNIDNTHTLVDNVESFEVWGEGGGSIIRMRLCLTDPQLEMLVGDEFEYCKESAVIR